MTDANKIKELKKKREVLSKKQRKEYETRGNTQYCQELWKEIEAIDEELSKEVEI